VSYTPAPSRNAGTPYAVTPYVPPAPAALPPPLRVGGTIRYRLPLRDSPDPPEALHCYAGCREAATEATYLDCLSQCPGFEVTADATCGPDDGTPRSVCLERHPRAPDREPNAAGGIVLVVLLNVALIVGLSQLCVRSASQCGYGYPYGYPYGPWRY
jgi:hypothetical protein